MKFVPETVESFFGHQKIQYTIPAYQRAYSWETIQTKTFLDDLFEHRNSDNNNPYCYGNILLETVSEGRKYEIIDGQQRITTISIFMRALLNVLNERIKSGSKFVISEDEEIIVEDEEDMYLKSHGIIKLRPTNYDRACFDTIIIENQNEYNCITPSQKRMLAAKKYFLAELSKQSNDNLLAIFKTLKNSMINHIELTGKKESALMFELQNNRGKDLTNLEKLKSFLMYQLYVYSEPDETESNIEYVSNQFNPIYNIVNQLSLRLGDNDESLVGNVNEDNVLIYHSYAYSKRHFGYRNLNDIFDEFKTVPVEEKVDWIKNYSVSLYNSFSGIQLILNMKNDSLDKLKRLNIPYFVYPFLIKGANKRESLPKLFKLMEVLSFRYKLINSRADIRSRLNDLIKDFDGNVDSLAKETQIKMKDAYYWGDTNFINVLNGNMYKNSMVNYLLWEYEQHLQRKGYIVKSTVKIDRESIEHISPQTEPNEKVESGYEINETGFYSEEFREKYINRLGNLMLISQSHNSSIGNKPFNDKLQSYCENPLLRQQSEIKDFVEDNSNPIWDSHSIEKRHKQIIDFAMQRWSFN
ncbi:MAG: DUF262 domain-containing protein [Eubacterium sp.]|nr:DUF262 domain-containing protein [Eubacterium sp.]